MKTLPIRCSDLRQAFLEFFAERDHKILSSSSLVPANDPTLLFTNAGMVQFKDYFTGRESSPYQRAVTSQRCLRAGGKHNDLDNVGYTSRHHTFFEMLGNFSFGDYFKREAIEYAWEFLTKTLQLPPERLWVTVYYKDQEAEDLWLKDMGIDPQRFSRCGDKDNFWSMGEIGPCGPCSEIFYDHGSDVPGGPPGSPDEDGDRYVEIWNLVFMQYERQVDGSLTPLPNPSVDTGMGLERVAAVMQQVHSNYEIDLFEALIRRSAHVLDVSVSKDHALQVISDHIRACAFLIADGVVPSNEGRGYVLRRILRRAIRHGYQLAGAPLKAPFFHKLLPTLMDEMAVAYPLLSDSAERIATSLEQEEIRFSETLDTGMALLNEVIENLSGTVIPGDVAFKLYDTYGFPVDLTADIAREHELTVDLTGFENAMQQQRDRARQANSFQQVGASLQLEGKTPFMGYEQLQLEAQIKALYLEDMTETQSLECGKSGVVVLDQTPFYAESGGQVGDQGILQQEGLNVIVTDTQKAGEVIIHHVKVDTGTLTVNQRVQACVDGAKRDATAQHHSATHLLHAALRQVLGEHVAQKGSLVDAEHLRFDFSHTAAISAKDIMAIEQLVNQHIWDNLPVTTELMDMEAAKSSGAMALFGEKYAQQVRVLSMGDFSKELCGGTHVPRTGHIGLCKITTETGIAAGVRRIEARSSAAAFSWLNSGVQALDDVTNLLHASRETVVQRVQQLQLEAKTLEKTLKKLKASLAVDQGDSLIDQAQMVGNINVVASLVESDANAMRQMLDQLKNKLGTSAIVLVAVDGKKARLVAGVSKDLSAQLSAVDLVNHVAMQCGGKGGGRADMAQAGAKNVPNMQNVLQSVAKWVEEQGCEA